jgi:hypothetical protein
MEQQYASHAASCCFLVVAGQSQKLGPIANICSAVLQPMLRMIALYCVRCRLRNRAFVKFTLLCTTLVSKLTSAAPLHCHCHTAQVPLLLTLSAASVARWKSRPPHVRSMRAATMPARSISSSTGTVWLLGPRLHTSLVAVQQNMSAERHAGWGHRCMMVHLSLAVM